MHATWEGELYSIGSGLATYHPRHLARGGLGSNTESPTCPDLQTNLPSMRCGTDPNRSIKSVANTIRSRFLNIRVLTNSAALDTRCLAEEIAPDQWDKDISVNLYHTISVPQSAAWVARCELVCIPHQHGHHQLGDPSMDLLPYATC